MSDIANILEEYRTYYVEFYSAAATQYAAKYQPSSPEVLLEVGGRDYLPYPFRLYRVDLASGAADPPNMTEVNPSLMPQGGSGIFAVGQLTVEIEPIMWNGVEIQVSPAIFEAVPLSEWALSWIDPSESRPKNEIGFSGYVHSVTWPELSEEEWSFSVDFGSAPVDAFLSLMRLLEKEGARHVYVSSRWAENET